MTPERISLLKEESAFQKLATSKKKGKEAQKEIEAGQAASGRDRRHARRHGRRLKSTLNRPIV